jgi:nucleoside-diphosphate-sugar epimerase
MSGKRIVFTGGTGKAGRHAVPHLVAHGYTVLNVDLKPLDLPGVPTLIADLTDNGPRSPVSSTAIRRARRTPWSISPPSRAS